MKGEFRKIQNYVYSYETIPPGVKFTPPSPDKIHPKMHELEQYLYNEEGEILIQLAVIHAQFALIHPFLDGNGRIGRILTTLFLYARKYLKYPVFYLSEYFEANCAEYKSSLLSISGKGDWQGWIEFFLRGIIKQSEIIQDRAIKILEIYKKTKTEVSNDKITDFLFKKPILTAPDFTKEGLITNNVTANRTALRLCELGILQKISEGSGTRATVYGFGDLLEVVRQE